MSSPCTPSPLFLQLFIFEYVSNTSSAHFSKTVNALKLEKNRQRAVSQTGNGFCCALRNLTCVRAERVEKGMEITPKAYVLSWT